ncbi:F-box protein [Corchorus capsularis]|uniref:F-box protein n=1 Tax=Corchorus capsularis TaxID=210143 RepID=A0A1R3G0X6_COCAP|nr:F-box protein [Corchorus capsularis]
MAPPSNKEKVTESDCEGRRMGTEDNFERLPDDVVMVIINKLIHMKTLIRFSLVAKRYSSLVPKTHSLFVELHTVTPPPTFLGRVGGFLSNLVAKFSLRLRGASSVPRPSPSPMAQKISLLKQGFQQVKHLHLHIGASASFKMQTASFKQWVAVGGSQSHFEMCVCLMASSVSCNSNSNSNPSGNGNHGILGSFIEQPDILLTSFTQLLKYQSERHELIRQFVLDLDHKLLETLVFTDDDSKGSFIMGKEEIARLQGKQQVSDPSELLACLLHLPTLDLPQSGYTLTDVIILAAFPVDQDRQLLLLDAAAAEEDENMESYILDHSVFNTWKVFEEAMGHIFNDDFMNHNMNPKFVFYIPYNYL